MSSLLAVWSAAQVALGISFLIFVHELGHFLVARYFGVRCEIFSIGFGPAILSYQRGETEYRLSWIPLGGYVWMSGEEPGREPSGDPKELASQPVYARMAIYIAGVAMNLIFAVVLFSVAFGLGVRFIHPQVGSTGDGSPAWHAGVLPGDVIRKIDGAPILNFDQIALNIAFADREKGIVMELERDGELIQRKVHPEYDEQRGVQAIGIVPATSEGLEVTEGSAAWKAGLRPGDQLVSVAGATDVGDNQGLGEALFDVRGSTFEVVYRRDGQEHTATIEAEASESHLLGVINDSPTLAHVRDKDPRDPSKDSVGERLGFEAGDTLRSIGGVDVHGVRQARDLVAEWREDWGDATEVVVTRGEEGKRVTITLPRDQAVTAMDDLAPQSNQPLIGSTKPGSPADRAGIAPGSRVETIDGAPIASWADLVKAVGAAEGGALEIAWVTPADEKRQATVTPEKVTRLGSGVGIAYPLKMSPTVRYGFVQALTTGLQHSKEMSIKVLMMVKALFTRQVSASNLGGPILIAQASYTYIHFGFGRFLYFLGLLSVNLVVLNLLPVPGLDGGHLLFLGIEGAQGKPLSPTAMGLTQTIGFFMILALIVFVVFNDILRLMS